MKHDPNDILDAAVALIDREGVGVSTTKVAAAAGVSNGTLFNYFPSKQALVDAIYRRLKQELNDLVGAPDPALSLREQFEQVWMRWGDWVVAQPERHRVSILLREAGMVSEAVTAETDAQRTFPQLFEDAAKAGVFIDLPTPYLAASILAQFDAAHRANLSRDERRRAFAAAWNGITPPAVTT